MGKKGRKFAERRRREYAREESLKRKRRKEDKDRTLTRRQETIRVRMEAVAMPLPDYAPAELRARAIQHWEIRNERPLDPAPDEGFVAKITVDFLRHEVSGYDPELRRRPPAGASKSEMDKVAKRTVLGRIAEKYPHLTAACRAQER